MFNNDYSKINSIVNRDTSADKFDYRGFFRGFVVNNNDPEGKGRVQVRIPSLDGFENNMSGATYTPNNNLKWAWPGILHCAANDMGTYLIPEPGTVVWVTFEYGSNDYIYFGGILAHKGEAKKYINPGRTVNGGKMYEITTDDKPTDIKTSAQKIIYKSPKGTTILVDDTDYSESISIIDACGQKIVMKNENNEKLLHRRNRSTTPKKGSSIELSRGSEYIRLEEGKIIINADEIVIKGKVKEE